MLLRNGKYTTDIERMIWRRENISSKTLIKIHSSTIKELENAFVFDGHQTVKNLRDLKLVFNKTDEQYLEMLKGFARIYKY